MLMMYGCIMKSVIPFSRSTIWGCTKRCPDWFDNEIYAYNNKHLLRSNTNDYDAKTYYIDSQNSYTTAPSGRELYHLQFSLQAASPETFGHTLASTEYKRQLIQISSALLCAVIAQSV
jgi:hypothetical protein